MCFIVILWCFTIVGSGRGGMHNNGFTVEASDELKNKVNEEHDINKHWQKKIKIKYTLQKAAD